MLKGTPQRPGLRGRPGVAFGPDRAPDFSKKDPPKGPSTQIVGFQGPKANQSMDFGT